VKNAYKLGHLKLKIHLLMQAQSMVKAVLNLKRVIVPQLRVHLKPTIHLPYKGKGKGHPITGHEGPEE